MIEIRTNRRYPIRMRKPYAHYDWTSQPAAQPSDAWLFVGAVLAPIVVLALKSGVVWVVW